MEEETLLLTQRDRDVLKVLHEVQRGHITQRDAAERLRWTDRWIRKLVKRMAGSGDRAIIHHLRGRPSTHKIAEKIEKKAITNYPAGVCGLRSDAGERISSTRSPNHG